MSWSFSFETTADTFDADAEKALANATNPPEQVEKGTDAMEAAIAAAKTLIESGVVGTDKMFRVSLSGHANTDHEPAEGWANDTLGVNISQQ